MSLAGELVVTASGGDSFDAGSILVSGDVEEAGRTWADVSGDSRVTAGDTITLTPTGEQFRVELVWSDESGETVVVGAHAR